MESKGLGGYCLGTKQAFMQKGHSSRDLKEMSEPASIRRRAVSRQRG